MNGVLGARVRMSVGALMIVGTSLLTACLKSTEPQASLLDLAGTWHYTGDQSGTVREVLDGKLTITRESGRSFQGMLVLDARNEQSQLIRQLNGSVTGSESGSDVIDFDANVDSPARRHVGRIVADTITGTWVGTSPEGTTSSGSFKVVRETR